MSPHTVGVSFLATDVNEGPGYVPPDAMGDVGPTQILVAANGRIKVFDKNGNLGALDADMDNFFNSVRNGSGTSDPRVRYDRLSKRWFVVIINVASTNNRVLLAVSSDSVITSSSSFTFFYFQHNTVAPAGDNNRFADYPTLGIDINALYIGTNNFATGFFGGFRSATGFVVRKSSILGSGPIVVSAFRNLCTNSVAGPYTPQGVDNDDPTSTQGYFIGVDAISYSLLVLRRVSDPGGTPTISGNINLTVPTTVAPQNVPAQGTSTLLDALDDRLFHAQIKKNTITGVTSLWTSHSFEVNSSGVGSTSGERMGLRWYEIRDLSTTPTLYQSGTLFDPAASNPRFFWISSVAMTGQGHMILSSSSAGVGRYGEIIASGRLSSDPLGSTQPFTTIQNSTTPYDVTVTNPQRWGDYSYTSEDPNDNMTAWTFQEYCSGTNDWGVRAIQLFAPTPVTPNLSTPSAVAPNSFSTNIIITGTSVNGSGYYDPGVGFSKHISALITGGVTINNIAFDSPTQVTLNINTTGVSDGFYDITITNPDGQTATGIGLLQIDSNLPVELSSFTASVFGNSVNLNWQTQTEINNYGFEIERRADNLKSGSWEKVGFIAGSGNSNSPKNYSFTDKPDQKLHRAFSYRLKQIDNDGKFEYSKTVEVDLSSPEDFTLYQNYPNPFNPVTNISFRVKQTQKVILEVFDMLGNKIEVLFNSTAEGGKLYNIEFNAEDYATGTYFYKLNSNEGVSVRKMILIK
jgi:hypothetical protein